MVKQIKRSKIYKILFSRIGKKKTTSLTRFRREVCKKCPLNSKNKAKTSIKISIIIWLSDLYSFITNNSEEDNLGNCTVCGCSVFYKTEEADEKCPKDKWN